MIDEYLMYRSDLAGSTINQYRIQLRKFFAFLSAGGMPPLIEDITTADINGYLTSLREQDASWSSKNHAHVALRGFFKWCVQAGRLTKSPFSDNIKRPKKPRLKSKVVSLTTAEKIINHIETRNSVTALRDAAMFRLILNTGIRREECAGIDLSRIDWDIARILIDGKGGDQRFVYPSDKTMMSLRTWVDNRPVTSDTALFVSTRPPYGQLKTGGLGKIFAKYAERAGIPDNEPVSPHTWRHRFATEYIANGGDPFTLKELMGHNYLSSTDRYLHPTEELLRRTASRAAPDV